jgi:hypothetical protein
MTTSINPKQPNSRSELSKLFVKPENIDTVFIKVLTKNDDSGRHGVLIPKDAYHLFDEFKDLNSSENNSLPITTLWRSDYTVSILDSQYKYYQRYPERRITGLHTKLLSRDRPDNALIIIGRQKSKRDVYDIHVLYPDNPTYSIIWSEVDIEKTPAPGLFYLDNNWTPEKNLKEPEAINELLDIFDRVSAAGYIKSLRTGSTGIGFTFETLAGIEENNSREADYRGIEIKTFRTQEFNLSSPKKQDLFLKEPDWTNISSSTVDRIKSYGYIDKNGRHALYSATKLDQNGHLLRLDVSQDRSKLFLYYQDEAIACWTREALQRRLTEKLAELVIISAKSRKTSNGEEFLYQTFLHCKEPSIDALLDLILSGSALIEIRMHVTTKNTARNHGTCFRIQLRDISRLFNSVKLLRNLT